MNLGPSHVSIVKMLKEKKDLKDTRYPRGEGGTNRGDRNQIVLSEGDARNWQSALGDREADLNHQRKHAGNVKGNCKGAEFTFTPEAFARSSKNRL